MSFAELLKGLYLKNTSLFSKGELLRQPEGYPYFLIFNQPCSGVFFKAKGLILLTNVFSTIAAGVLQHMIFKRLISILITEGSTPIALVKKIVNSKKGTIIF